MYRMRALNSLAIIPDGNRRYAKKQGLNLAEAYAAGFSKVGDVLDWSGDAGVRSVTFWALSLDNYNKRTQAELRVLFSLMRNKADEVLSSRRFNDEGCRVRFFGRRDLLPSALEERFAKLECETQNNRERELGIAIAYSGRDELLQASKRLCEDYAAGRLKNVDERAIEERLYSTAAPDLVIRTGDAPRLSGFLPWQAAYSELYFSKVLWPEFDEKEFKRAVDFYSRAETRLGG